MMMVQLMLVTSALHRTPGSCNHDKMASTRCMHTGNMAHGTHTGNMHRAETMKKGKIAKLSSHQIIGYE